MNPRLLWALGAVLAATVWLQWQSTDEGATEASDLLAEPAPRSAQAGNPSTARAPVAASGATPSAASGPAASQVLVQAMAQRDALQARLSAPASSRTPPLWLVAEPPPPPRPTRQAETPPAPVAPRFPHIWVGRLDDEPAPGVPAVQRAVLQSPRGVWVVRAGDVIENTWRIERIQARALQLTYLPLGQAQTVTLP